MTEFFKKYECACQALREQCDQQVANGELTEDESYFRYEMVKDEILMSMPEDNYLNCEDYDYDYDDYGFEEENLLTNFRNSQLPTYQKALEIYSKRFNDDTLYISEEAYDRRGNSLSDCHSLRYTEGKERGDFWRIFEELDRK